MNKIVEFGKNVTDNKTLKTAALIIVPTVVAVVAYRKYKRAQRRKAYPKDVVILHQYPNGLRAPSPSPWSLKLETWIRMAKIPYQNEQGYEFGPKGKMPWITLNGQDLGDSQFCIEFLSKKFNVNFSSNFTAAENGIARAFFKMTDESLTWAYILDTVVYNPNRKYLGVPAVVLWIIQRISYNRAKKQGYGLHTPEELLSIGYKDLQSLNDFIGNKKFLLGDQVCDADAALFGLLTMINVINRGPLNKYYVEKCPNLLRYHETIKKAYWPDWNDRCKLKMEA